MTPLSLNQCKTFARETLVAGVIIALPVYAWVRVIFFEVPFSFGEDSMTLLKTIFTSWIIMMLFRAGWYLLLLTIRQIELHGLRLFHRNKWAVRILMIAVLSCVLYACSAQPSGFYKDAGTGLTTQYAGLRTSGAQLVMNKEVLNHTDIPIGESFEIINTGVEGLTVKNNKVAVSCSLQIKNSKGEMIFSVPDLFKGKGIFQKDRVDYLRCTVNTGKPMEWEENYEVTAVFTDKYGKGRIENTVTIRMIDIP